MKIKLLTRLAAFAVMTNTALAAGNGWMTDFEAAKKKAATEKKDLLIEFTGSDWCPPCKRMNETVFSKDTFIKAASEKFVLVALDYPRNKKLPAAEKKQNDKLMGIYAVQGFPTVLLCDSNGMPYAKEGFVPGGPKAYLAAIDTKIPAKKQLKDAIAVANKLEGKAKADALWAALNGLEGVPVALSFDSVLKSILAADKTDADGKIEGIYLNAELAALEEGKDFKPVFKKYDAYLAKIKVTGEKKQQMLTKKLDALYGLKNFAGMRTVIDEIIAIAPDSRMGKGLKASKPRISQMEKAHKAQQEVKKPAEVK